MKDDANLTKKYCPLKFTWSLLFPLSNRMTTAGNCNRQTIQEAGSQQYLTNRTSKLLPFSCIKIHELPNDQDVFVAHHAIHEPSPMFSPTTLINFKIHPNCHNHSNWALINCYLSQSLVAFSSNPRSPTYELWDLGKNCQSWCLNIQRRWLLYLVFDLIKQ
jgi:hypothetical protein